MDIHILIYLFIAANADELHCIYNSFLIAQPTFSVVKTNFSMVQMMMVERKRFNYRQNLCLSLKCVISSWTKSMNPSHLFSVFETYFYFWKFRPRGCKTFFMLSSTEHEISTAHKKLKYRQMKKFLALSLSDDVFVMLINVKMKICELGINFVLSWVEHGKGFIISRPYLFRSRNSCRCVVSIIIFFLILSGIPLECQTVWIQIRSDVLSDLVRVQFICKGYQQKTRGGKILTRLRCFWQWNMYLYTVDLPIMKFPALVYWKNRVKQVFFL